MSLDPAMEFLVRKDRKALQKRLGKEKAVSVVQAKHSDQVGLLAGTKTRLVFVYKRGWRHRHVEFPRKELAKITEERSRYGAVVLHRKTGGTARFEMLQAGAARVFVDKAAPGSVSTGASRQVREGGPMVFRPKADAAPKPAAPSPPRGQAHDPLTATKEQKLARLERLREKGMITDAEYRWQRDALTRS